MDDHPAEKAPSAPLPRVVLGHGASGSAASMQPWVVALARRGIHAAAIDLPKGKAERAVPVFEAAIARAVAEFEPAPAPSDAEGAGQADGRGRQSRVVVPGGHSFGGRVASLAVAGMLPEDRDRIAGLVLLSYPLHRPGGPETWRDRTAHWPNLDVPVLILSGESDPFARIDLLREALHLLPDGRMYTYRNVGHGLGPVLDDAADRAAAFIESLRVRGRGKARSE